MKSWVSILLEAYVSKSGICLTDKSFQRALTDCTVESTKYDSVLIYCRDMSVPFFSNRLVLILSKFSNWVKKFYLVRKAGFNTRNSFVLIVSELS